MLKIRLQRVGRKNVTTFRVVLTDSKNGPKSGKFLEILGSFDPVNDVKVIDTDRVKHWLSKGAKLSNTLHNHLISKKVIPGEKIAVIAQKSLTKNAKKEEVKPAEAPKA